jgi:hypothetical protein
VFQVIAVHEGHVEERALKRRQLAVEGPLYDVLGRLLCLAVGGVAARLLLPAVQSARRGLLVEGLEAVADLTVEIGILLKPRLA